MSSAEGPAIAVTVYSREDCHLCEEAIADVERVAEDIGATVAIEEIDVDGDEELAAEYGERVPYVLLDGEPAYKYRVDTFDLRRRLQERVEEG
ncbi:MAG: glutaredoxin family protein [Haloferacaceae archaeon]